MIGQAAGERIAVSLVTGFLGSGKTTLIAALLKQPAMDGTAVVVNEFGAVGIDDAIFAQSIEANDVLLLANGCLCCTAGDDLAATVWSLARRVENRPRRIVIETTGLADPAPALRRLMGDPRLKQTTRLDTVVATISAVSGLQDLDDHPVTSRQCALADRRLITKADLARPEDVAELAARLRSLNPGADIRQVEHGRIDAGELFGAALYDTRSGGPDLGRWLNLEAHRGSSGHHHHHIGHDDAHDPAVGTWLVEEKEPVDWDLLSRRLGEIVRLYGDRLLRVKGVIRTAGDERPLVIHGVQRLFHAPVRLERWLASPSTSIVVIGDRSASAAIGLIAEALAGSVVVAPTRSARRAPAPVPV